MTERPDEQARLAAFFDEKERQKRQSLLDIAEATFKRDESEIRASERRGELSEGLVVRLSRSSFDALIAQQAAKFIASVRRCRIEQVPCLFLHVREGLDDLIELRQMLVDYGKPGGEIGNRLVGVPIGRLASEILECAAIYAEALGVNADPFVRAQTLCTPESLADLRAGRRRLVQAIEAAESGQSPTGPGPLTAHAEDFNWVMWNGRRFQFSKGHQAEAVRVLWESWERSGRRDGCGLSEKTIGARISFGSDRFRLVHVFRKNPAWGTMIRSAGKGVFALYASPPDPADEGESATQADADDGLQ